MSQAVQIVEVGPRDGFQSVGPFIPTTIKIALLTKLYEAGVRRMEATSFVSQRAVPQLADAAEVLAAADALTGLDAQVLVPTVRQAERALTGGASHLVFVLSTSERHNISNVKRTPRESVEEYRELVTILPDTVKLRLNVATAFDCPYDGYISKAKTFAVLEPLIAAAPHAEVALCDTTGRVDPNHDSRLFEEARMRFPEVRNWAFHAHDTYGLGTANTLAAWNAGIRIFDASFAGLGGCPFAPGATGNVATEDLVWMFEGMGVDTGMDLDKLIEVAEDVSFLPGVQVGGRVRDAMRARRGQAKAVSI